MAKFLRLISDQIRKFRVHHPPKLKSNFIHTRFICGLPIVWDLGSARGDGVLKEVSSKTLRFKTSRPMEVGKFIRVFPPNTSERAIGTVRRSRSLRGEVEITVELVSSELLSRIAFLNQIDGDKIKLKRTSRATL